MARPTRNQAWRTAIGRKVTKLSPEVVQKLKQAFAIGATVKQACYYAEISERTYYNWVEKNPVLLQEFDAMRERLPLAAKTNIATAIESTKDIGLSKWLVERTEGETYGETVKVQHSGAIGDGDLHPEDEALRKEYKDKRRANIQKRWQAKEKTT